MDEKEREVRKKIRKILIEEGGVVSRIDRLSVTGKVFRGLAALSVFVVVVVSVVAIESSFYYGDLRAENNNLRMMMGSNEVEPDYDVIVSIVTGYHGDQDPDSPVYQWVVNSYKQASIEMQAIPKMVSYSRRAL